MQNKTVIIFKNPSNFRGVFYFILFFITFLNSIQAQLNFKDAKKNFGFAKKGEVIKMIFDYTNIGNQPVFITNAEAECSCTTIEYSKKPIEPNQSGVITIFFDTKSVYDRQDRIVKIYSNFTTQKLRFKGVVLK